MTAKQRNTWIVGVLIVLILVVGSWFGAISPQLNARATAKDEAAASRQAAVDANAQAKDLELKALNIQETITKANQLTSQFPTDYQQGELLNMINAAAGDAAVEIRSISPGLPGNPATKDSNGATAPILPPVATAPVVPGAQAPAATPVPAPVPDPAATAVTGSEFDIAQASVAIEAFGNARNLVTFISKLESLGRPIVIQNIEMAGEGNEMTLKVTGTTYLTRPLTVPAELTN